MVALRYFRFNHKAGYFPWTTRTLLALIIAHSIVVEGQSKSFLVVMQQRNYYIAVGVSFFIALALISFVHYVTLALDKVCNWRKFPFARCLLQFLVCVWLVLQLDVYFVKAYFSYFHRDFYASGYMNVEYPIVKWMVITLNLTYAMWFWIFYYFESNNKLSAKVKELSRGSGDTRIYAGAISAKLGNKKFQVDIYSIVCLEKKDKIGYVWLDDGNRYVIDYTMNELENMLNPVLFFPASRSTMFSLIFVKGYIGFGNQQVELILKADLDSAVSRVVTRKKSPEFLKRYKKFNPAEFESKKLK